MGLWVIFNLRLYILLSHQYSLSKPVGLKPRLKWSKSIRTSLVIASHNILPPFPSNNKQMLRVAKNCKAIMRWSPNSTKPPQRGSAVPDPVSVGSKWLLTFSRAPVTLGTLLEPFFAVLLPERPQKGSAQLFKNRFHVFSLLLLFSCPSSSPQSSSSLDKH